MNAQKLGYEKAKRQAKKIYSKIGRIKCSALSDEYVFFTSAGFNHLLRKGRIPRTRNEQKRRFTLLPYIEKIIKNPTAKITYKKIEIKEKANRHGEKVLIESTAYFWTFIEKIDDCKIKVVIRQLENKNKHFFSVMGDNVKIISTRRKNRINTKKPLK
ncbi:MAG: hypothetical protein PHO90_02020 [Candidatus Pacebacteria bacterium]|nr:hypothetical protein [Candidatus Paceibacterota bacterium]